jgi:porphobilinogen synthase
MPLRRPRRNRKSAALRGLMRETHLTPDHLIYPLFLVPGKGIKDEISSLPGNFRLSEDQLLREMEESQELGLANFILFPAIPEAHKDKTATYSYHPENFYLKVARSIKERFPQINLISDVAMDPYSVDGPRWTCQERKDR